MNKSTFKVTAMDCSAEEQMIRMKLEPLSQVERLDFDLPARKLVVYHRNEAAPLAKSLGELGLGGSLLTTEAADLPLHNNEDDAQQKRILWWVLGINAAFFVVEMAFGLISGSMGLVADSLDMLADALVYALSLLAVGAAVARKKQIAGYSGYLQLGLAIMGFAEVIRRFLGYGEVPDFKVMIVVAALAMIGNAVCLWLIQQTKRGEAHMEASYIFTSNDIIINFGVIISGVLVYLTATRWPDLIVGSIVFAIVLRGAFRILKLSK
ncbi:cation transporter [Neolewinella agarilytica]|uniref:Cation efflux family protein n=1 Tax=Neolewinella agarilytica TaxID=478744 RepID=A0A1H9H4L2_9BACT|nr:cation transporter [Neolewinella agarilytica]SEQ57188.1 Cation efflux family protein [Neolewinella agarilytica]